MADKVSLNAKIDKDLHKKLKIQLLKDEITYKEWVVKRIGEYVEK